MSQPKESFIQSEVVRIFREVFENSRMTVTPETSREQLPEWDSVMQVKLVLALEEAFDVQFTTDDVASVHTAGEFVKVVEAHKA